MLRKVLLPLFLLLVSFSYRTQAQAVMIDTARDHFIRIDDVTLRYKTWGKGEPVILLHGAMEYWREWERQIPAIAKDFKVIAIDTRGHGLSTFTDRELSYDLFANDIIQFIDKMNLDSVAVVGFGDGGIIGMEIAMKRPEKIHKLIAIGSNIAPDTNAIYQAVLDKVAAWNYEKMAFYLQVKFKENPNPKLLPILAKRMQKLLLNEPHLTLDDLNRIQCPTLIMAGDHDFIKLSHINYIFSNLPNGYMSIIPAGTHYCIKEKYTLVNTAIVDFLKWKVEKVFRY
ncbi:MAG: alpha/beta hydrolase fold protein [Bacteroidetes bacterium]|nr:alpha/beta hydrolase fold protein [Bacteroidota bacterium]